MYRLQAPGWGDGDPLVRLAVIIAMVTGYFGDPVAKLTAIIGLLVISKTIGHPELDARIAVPHAA